MEDDGEDAETASASTSAIASPMSGSFTENADQGSSPGKKKKGKRGKGAGKKKRKGSFVLEGEDAE